MKTENKISAYILMVVMTILAGFFTSCGSGDPTPTKSTQDVVKEKLTLSSWSVQTVTVDGVDQSNIYKNLTIKFSASGYTATNGGAIWPANGTWSFTDETAAAIKRDDGTEVEVEVTDTSLKLTLTWMKTTLGSGREKSVKGLHVFTFRK